MSRILKFILIVFFISIFLVNNASALKTYTSIGGDYKLEYSAGWSYSENGFDKVTFTSKTGRGVLTIIAAPSYGSLNDIVAKARVSLNEKGINPFETKDVNINGVAGIEWKYISKDATKRIKYKQVYLLVGSKYYTITAYSQESDYPFYTEDFDQIINSFKVTTAPPPSIKTTPASTAEHQYLPITATQGEELSEYLEFSATYGTSYAWADASGEAASWVTPRHIDFGTVYEGKTNRRDYNIRVPDYQNPGYYEMIWTWGCKYTSGETCTVTGDTVLQITVNAKPTPVYTKPRPTYTYTPKQDDVASTIIGFLIILILFIIWIYIVVWVARDAKKRGASGTLWGLLAFFLGLIGLLLHLAARPKGNIVLCDSCGKEKLETLARCPHCNRPTAPVYKPAPVMHAPVQYTALPHEPEVAAEEQSASVSLHGEKTEVVPGEDIILKLSAVSIITQPAMTVQVILIPPSGMSVTSTEFVTSGAGQYTTTYKLEPGNARDIEVRIKTNQIGEFEVRGRIIYYFGEDKSTAEYHTLKLPIKVRSDKEQRPEIKTGKAAKPYREEKESAFDEDRQKQLRALPPDKLDSDTRSYLGFGVNTALSMLDAEISKAESDASEMQEELNKNEEVLDKLVDRLANKEISEQTYNDLKNKYKRKVSELKSKVARLESEAAKKQKIRSFIQEKGEYYA